jgi:hypothetical protein
MFHGINNKEPDCDFSEAVPEADSSPFGTSPQLAAPAKAAYAAVRCNRKFIIFC